MTLLLANGGYCFVGFSAGLESDTLRTPIVFGTLEIRSESAFDALGDSSWSRWSFKTAVLVLDGSFTTRDFF